MNSVINTLDRVRVASFTVNQRRLCLDSTKHLQIDKMILTTINMINHKRVKEKIV